MDFGYIRLWRSGPNEAEQRAALGSLGLSDQNHIETEARPPRRGKLKIHAGMNDDRITGLPAVIRRLRPGDRILVYSAAVLTVGRHQVHDALLAIGRQGGCVYDIKAAVTVVCPSLPEIEAFIDRAERGWQDARISFARKALEGIHRGPQKTKLKISDAKAKAMWHDQTNYTKLQIETETGVKRSTLWKRFGPRAKGI